MVPVLARFHARSNLHALAGKKNNEGNPLERLTVPILMKRSAGWIAPAGTL
jgi:hypothetical protein